MNKYDKSVKEVATEKIQKEFLTMEEQEVQYIHTHLLNSQE